MRTRFGDWTVPTGMWRFSLALLLSVSLHSCDSLRAPGLPASESERQQRIESLYQTYRADFPDVNEVTPQGVLDLQETGNTILVDVRTPEEQAVSMLPGAIAREAFEAAREAYQNYTVVTYCTIGARSGAYAEQLRQEDVDVFNLKGSILAWTHAGLPLLDAEGKETRRLHTYGRQWDLVADGYEGTW